MKRSAHYLLAFALCALPLWAGAHAAPVEYVPAASATLTSAPKEVQVRFSERIDLKASSLRVTGPGGTVVSGTPALGSTTRILEAPLSSEEKGTYTVKWSVVSADDGHFTRGEFIFSVGSSADAVPTFELVVRSNGSEALAMTLELLGNGMLWALLVLFAVALRPRLSDFKNERPFLFFGYRTFGWTAVALALTGQVLQLLIKSADLASVRDTRLWEGAMAYASTGAGEATLVRALVIILIAGLLYARGRAIFDSPRITRYEWVLGFLLVCFAIARGLISHATANPFFPEFSVAVNVFHLIEKDLWAGSALALLLLSLAPRLHALLRAALPRASLVLAANLALVGTTGSYIVWLHLESFGNFLGTAWGEAFLPLLVAAVLLVSVRTYHALMRASTITLGTEAMLAVLVVYYSSVVILTSPPLHHERHFDFFALAIFAAALGAVGLAMLLAKAHAARFVPRHPSLAVLGAAVAAAVFAGILLLLPFLGVENAFKRICVEDGNMWHFMQPMRAGKPVSEDSVEGCMWGMGAYPYMFAEREEYERYRSLPPARVELQGAEHLSAGVPAEFSVSLTKEEGTPAELFIDMEKLVHVVISSADQSVFAHIHSAETAQERESGTYHFRYEFPKAGEYLISVDYALGISSKAEQFRVQVGGAPAQGETQLYPQEGTFGGYTVSLKYPLPRAGEVSTLVYTIMKDGHPVAYLEPYLAAPMHVSVVKHDLSAFIHAHGEVHASGTPPLPPRVILGKVAHSHLPTPPSFGPIVDAHVIFPSAGLYTVWGEFKAKGIVVPTAFTVRVEE